LTALINIYLLLDCSVDCSIDMFGLAIVLMELYVCGNSMVGASPGESNYAIFRGESEEAQIRLYAEILEYSAPVVEEEEADAYTELLLRASGGAAAAAAGAGGGSIPEVCTREVPMCSIPPSMLDHCSVVKKDIWFEWREQCEDRSCTNAPTTATADAGATTTVQFDRTINKVLCWRVLDVNRFDSVAQFQPLSVFIMAKKHNANQWLCRSTLSENQLQCEYGNSSTAQWSPSYSPDSKRMGPVRHQQQHHQLSATSHDMCQFVSFLDLLFTWSPQTRIPPSKAPRHPWFK